MRSHKRGYPVILVAKELFRIDKHFAVFRIDDDPEFLDQANAVMTDLIKSGQMAHTNFGGIVFIRRGRYNNRRSMDPESWVKILSGFITHIREAIEKVKF